MSQIVSAIKRQLAVHNLPPHPDKRILLTFDDGPHATRTPRVLDILEEFGARAVFFVIGKNVNAETATVRQTMERGHILGNHSQTHVRVRSPIQAYREVELCQREVNEAVGYRPKLYRPPYGQLSSPTVPYAMLTGLRRVLWSIDPKDFKIRSSEAAVQAGAQLAEELNRPERRSEIVLLHDESPYTADLLESLLKNLGPCDLSTGAGSLNR